ncbi:shikimate kinase [bacterium]|nr:shikimate kinase [bacterium]
MNGPQPNLVLIGYRGTGKSSVARVLAERMRRPVRSSDEELIARAGMSIPDFVAANGWDRFRDLEEEIIAELCAQPGIILDCGGGVVLRAANRQALRRTGRVVWLKASPGVIRARIADKADRPSLTGKPFLEEITEVLAAREPLYRETAHWTLDGDPLTVEAMAQAILAWWENP